MFLSFFAAFYEEDKKFLGLKQHSFSFLEKGLRVSTLKCVVPGSDHPILVIQVNKFSYVPPNVLRTRL